MKANPSARKRRLTQLDLPVPPASPRGGRRRGAGRKKVQPGALPHTRRPPLASRHPVHVTLKVDERLPDLREELGDLVEQCFRESKVREGFRLVHYSIMTHHLHLIVEASNAACLSRGVQALSIRIAKRLNRALHRRGRVFVDRYFGRTLKTPRETRGALSYVLLNCRRHAWQHGRTLLPGWLDQRSSGRYFDGWRDGRPPPLEEEPAVAPPRTWLLSTGWRRHGLLSISDVPGARLTRSSKFLPAKVRRPTRPRG